MSVDTDSLIIGAGMSGIGFAVQLQKHYRRPGMRFSRRRMTWEERGG